jgi:arginyl-tRNA--protein-N-Asp/Glu arginylyltransferase
MAVLKLLGLIFLLLIILISSVNGGLSSVYYFYDYSPDSSTEAMPKVNLF